MSPYTQKFPERLYELSEYFDESNATAGQLPVFLETRAALYSAGVKIQDLRFALIMCIQRIERPELSPGADVVLKRARAALDDLEMETDK